MPVSTPLESLIAQMTVAELAERTGRSVTDLVASVLGDRPRASAATSAARTADKPTRGGKGGRPAGRGAASAGYDESVLSAIRSAKGKVKAQDLRKKTGGTPLEIRAALKRLLGAGHIKSQGKARGTTYTAA